MQADIKISPVKIINQQFQFQKERREENFIKKKKRIVARKKEGCNIDYVLVL